MACLNQRINTQFNGSDLTAHYVFQDTSFCFFRESYYFCCTILILSFLYIKTFTRVWSYILFCDSNKICYSYKQKESAAKLKNFTSVFTFFPHALLNYPPSWLQYHSLNVLCAHLKVKKINKEKKLQIISKVVSNSFRI